MLCRTQVTLGETLLSLVTSQRAIFESCVFSATLSERWEEQKTETMEGCSFWVVEWEATGGTSSLSENISREICIMWDLYTNIHTTAVSVYWWHAEHVFKPKSKGDVKTHTQGFFFFFPTVRGSTYICWMFWFLWDLWSVIIFDQPEISFSLHILYNNIKNDAISEGKGLFWEFITHNCSATSPKPSDQFHTAQNKRKRSITSVMLDPWEESSTILWLTSVHLPLNRPAKAGGSDWKRGALL